MNRAKKVSQTDETPAGKRGKVVYWRRRAKMSQSAAADALGVHRQTIIKIEGGMITLSEKWLRRLAKLYGCQPVDLLEETPTPENMEENGTKSVMCMRFPDGMVLDIRANTDISPLVIHRIEAMLAMCGEPLTRVEKNRTNPPP